MVGLSSWRTRPSAMGVGEQVGRVTRVLIVDDYPGTAKLIAELLAKAGHETVAVESAPEALELCKTQHFDLLISDIVMPGKSGWDLMREIRRHCQIRGIAISGNPKVDQVTSLVAGFDTHLVKPIDLDKLIKAVDQALDN